MNILNIAFPIIVVLGFLAVYIGINVPLYFVYKMQGEKGSFKKFINW